MEIILIVLLILLGFIFIVYTLKNKNSNQDIQACIKMLEMEQRNVYELRQEFMRMQMDLQKRFHDDFERFHDVTAQQMIMMEKNVKDNLLYGQKNTDHAFAQVMEQMGRMDETQAQLKEVSSSLSMLQNVLTDKKSRGTYGEIELYALLDFQMQSHYQRYAKQYKLDNGYIVDAVLFGVSGIDMLCIDSKFPMENYQRILSSKNKEEERRYHQLFISDVKKHIKAIAQKYIIEEQTAPFAFMFIPAEAVFSYIHANCEELVQLSFTSRVYFVSPTTLMATTTAIKAMYLDAQRDAHARDIQKELQKLQQEFNRFSVRYESVRSDFDKNYQDLQSLHTTAVKIMRRFEAIAQVQLKEEENK